MSEALRKAAEQALEALDEAEPYVAEVGDEIHEFHSEHPIRLKYHQSAREREERNRSAQSALRAALAEPEQFEPVAWIYEDQGSKVLTWAHPRGESTPLYACSPPHRESYPLPDDLYDSKDWRDADYAGRVEWLHTMYEGKKAEIDAYLMGREPLSDEQVGMLTVFDGLHHVETPLLAEFIHHIEAAHGITGGKE